jgi:hypothetical protein
MLSAEEGGKIATIAGQGKQIGLEPLC